jgi:hypothetical protein
VQILLTSAFKARTFCASQRLFPRKKRAYAGKIKFYPLGTLVA